MKIYLTDGPQSGKEVEIRESGLTLGREVDNDISILVGGVSRYHAKIEKQGESWVIKDLGSTNGTKVNNNIISSPFTLTEGDSITLGDQNIRFGEAKVITPPPPASNSALATPPASPFGNISPDPITPASNSAQATPPASPFGNISPDPIPNQPATPAPPASAAPTPPPVTPPVSPTPEGAPLFGQPDQVNADSPTVSQPTPDTDIPEKGLFGNIKKSIDDKDVKGMNFFGSNSESVTNNKTDEDEDKHKSTLRSNLIFYTCVCCAAIILVAIFIKTQEAPKDSGANVNGKNSAPKTSPFVIVYERQTSSKNNIFRFTMTLEKNTAKITLDDVVNHIHFPKTVTAIPETIINALKQKVKDNNFMNLKSPTAGVPDKVDDYRYILSSYDNELNTVTVRNAYPDGSFTEIERAIDDFCTTQLNVPLTRSPDELRADATEAFNKAEDLFLNYEARPSNLKNAIKWYQMVEDRLKIFSTKIEIYDLARKQKQKAQAILDTKKNDIYRNAQQAYYLKDYVTAKADFKRLLELLDENSSNEADRRYYEKIKGHVRNLEELLRRQERK